ncbi:hypothetical protein D3C79_890240 [compost metagenome]
MSPKRRLTQSRSRKRALRKARVAPRVLAKETSSSPQPTPNKALPPRVSRLAPGRERAVVTT